MADVRTLKLNLLADVDQFGRGIGQAKVEMSGFDKTVKKISKAATAAFYAMATAAAYSAIRIGKDSVEAAIADQESQATLAKALQNTTNATEAQIKSTEDWITKQQLSYGISDSKLRPALANLARATGDVEQAQRLTNLAMDISAATGKDLESVSLALAKANNGNLGALTRLGVPLDANIIKTKDFAAATSELEVLFGGAAQTSANTYAGKLRILDERTSELKESLGNLLLPQVQRFVEYANAKLLPALEQVAGGFAGDKSANTSAYRLGESIRALTDSFGALFTALTGGKSSDATSNVEALAKALNNVAKAVNGIAAAFEYLNRIWDKIPDKLKPLATLSTGAFQKFAGIRAAGGSVMGGQAYRVGEFGPEMFVPSGSGSIRPAGASGNVTININGIVDAESARRSIERLLQDSGRRTAAVNLVGSSL